MGILTKGEFAEKCGMPSRTLSVYIKRGKVLVKKDGTIDDTELQNVDFWNKHKDKVSGKTVVAKPKLEPKKREPKNNPDPSLYEIEKKRKEIDLKTRERELEITNAKWEKMMGRMLPVDSLKPLLAQHFKDISVAFNQQMDVFVTEISKKHHLNLNQAAELRGRIAEMINNAVNNSIDSTNKSIRNLAKELSLNNSSGNKL